MDGSDTGMHRRGPRVSGIYRRRMRPIFVVEQFRPQLWSGRKKILRQQIIFIFASPLLGRKRTTSACVWIESCDRTVRETSSGSDELETAYVPSTRIVAPGYN